MAKKKSFITLTDQFCGAGDIQRICHAIADAKSQVNAATVKLLEK